MGVMDMKNKNEATFKFVLDKGPMTCTKCVFHAAGPDGGNHQGECGNPYLLWEHGCEGGHWELAGTRKVKTDV